jgi:hypothetical protein
VLSSGPASERGEGPAFGEARRAPASSSAPRHCSRRRRPRPGTRGRAPPSCSRLRGRPAPLPPATRSLSTTGSAGWSTSSSCRMHTHAASLCFLVQWSFSLLRGLVRSVRAAGPVHSAHRGGAGHPAVLRVPTWYATSFCPELAGSSMSQFCL